MMNYYQRLKEMCNHIQQFLCIDEEGEYEVFPCEYMIKYFVNRDMNYFLDALQPSKNFCLNCPYRNKDMGKDFEMKLEDIIRMLKEKEEQ